MPVRSALWEEFGASSLIVSVPVREPVAVGVKVTEIVHDNLAPNVIGDCGQFVVSTKSPEAEISVIVRGTV